MSFYRDKTTSEEQTYYNRMLTMMGSLSNLYSTSNKPFLHYRVTENLFCKCLGAENLSRSDITADAKKGNIGIGIKTWVDSNIQKIAEFDASRPEYESKSDEEIVRIIADLRNERINFTERTNGLSQMIYHCTIRDKGVIKIAECPLEPINISNIHNIQRGSGRSRNTITFTDGLNNYQFSVPKSTLYKNFSSIRIIKELPVKIISDPFTVLEKKFYDDVAFSIIQSTPVDEPIENTVYLPLYSITKTHGKEVMPASGLNIRFAKGRRRNPYEVYIRIPAAFNKLHRAFFPPTDTPFDMLLPNGKHISAKICQQGDKALMSNPNEALGHWLIDDVLKISPQTIITYEMLEKYGVDSVEIKKIDDGQYKINFAKIGSYEDFMGTKNEGEPNEITL